MNINITTQKGCRKNTEKKKKKGERQASETKEKTTT